jgi:hypothetical protein
MHEQQHTGKRTTYWSTAHELCGCCCSVLCWTLRCHMSTAALLTSKQTAPCAGQHKRTWTTGLPCRFVLLTLDATLLFSHVHSNRLQSGAPPWASSSLPSGLKLKLTYSCMASNMCMLVNSRPELYALA